MSPSGGDDTGAFQQRINEIAAKAPSTVFPSRAYLKPIFPMEVGEYYLTSVGNITPGMRFKGAGKYSSVLYVNPPSDTGAFELGQFHDSILDVFGPKGNVQDVDFEDMAIIFNPQGVVNGAGVPGARTGCGIRQTGGGGITLRNCLLVGLKYGVNSVCGGDFIRAYDTDFHFCDVGAYAGPGAQQALMVGCTFYKCHEGGLVADRVASLVMVEPVFYGCRGGGLVLETISDTSTRQLEQFNPAGTTQQCAIELVNPWFESDGTLEGTSEHFVRFDINSGDTTRGLKLRNTRIFAGSGVTHTRSLIGSVGTTKAQAVEVDGGAFSGEMDYYFSGVGGYNLIREPIVEGGYTAPHISDGDDGNVMALRTDGRTFGIRTDSHTSIMAQYLSQDGATGVQTEYEFSAGAARIRWARRVDDGWNTGGLYDVERKRLHFGDERSPGFDFGPGPPAAGSGEFPIGWVRFDSTGQTAGWRRKSNGWVNNK